MALILVALLLVSGPGPADAQAGGAGAGAAAFTLTLLHVGDTHSKLEPAEARLSVGGVPVVAEFGGFPQLMRAVREARARDGATLFVHAGDMFQGSLYFTRYLGVADTEFWNLMGLDAATLGNHEFDRGPSLLQSSLLALARFPVVASNVDARPEPALDAARILPFAVARVGAEEVGLVGLTTTETPFISSPGSAVRFLDPAASAQAAVDALRDRGVDKVVLLSHRGYEQDLRLARQLSGVDVIVSGHSHTLLGDFETLGLRSWGPYPTVAAGKDGKRVLVVAAWEGAKVLGRLRVSFDDQGDVVAWEGAPQLVVGRRLLRVEGLRDAAGQRSRVEATRGPSGELRLARHDGTRFVPVSDAAQAAAWRAEVEPLFARLAADPVVALVDADPEGARRLEGFAQGVAELRTRVVAHAETDMPRGRNRGPGPLVADSMAWRTGARIALNNPGGVRTGITEGPITVAEAYELLPFGNTLVTLGLTGAQVLSALEEAVDYQVSRYGPDERAPYVYVSGMTFTIDLAGPRGKRIRDARVRDEAGGYAPIDAAARYLVAVNSFMAEGGDRYDSFKDAPDKYDTGFGDVEAFVDYISGKRLAEPREERVRVVR